MKGYGGASKVMPTIPFLFNVYTKCILNNNADITCCAAAALVEALAETEQVPNRGHLNLKAFEEHV